MDIYLELVPYVEELPIHNISVILAVIRARVEGGGLVISTAVMGPFTNNIQGA